MALQWVKTSNPAPELQFQATWVVAGVTDSTGNNLTITSGNDNVVTIGKCSPAGPDGNGTYQFSVQIVGQTTTGLTSVTASEPGNTDAVAPVVVGEILAYDQNGDLQAAQSQQWSLVDQSGMPTTFPSAAGMGANGLAYATWGSSAGYVLNWGTLNDEMTPSQKQSDQFFTSGTASQIKPDAFPDVMWAYDPSGNLWLASGGAWAAASLDNVPTPGAYTVAWVPETDGQDAKNAQAAAGAPAIIANVTCYLLNWAEAEKVRDGDSHVPVYLPTILEQQ